MRRTLDSLLAAPGLTRSRFIALAMVSLIATSVVIAEGLRRDGSPYGLLAAAYSRPAPQVEVTAAPAAAPPTAVAAAPAGDSPAASSDAPAAVADSAVAAAPVQTPAASAPASTPAPAPTPTTPVAAKPASKIKHVFVVDIAGSDHEATWGDTSTATYLNGTLKPQGVLLGGYKALPEGDLATLVALTSGQAPTPQTTSGCPQYGNDCTLPVETLSLADQINAKGLRWRAYLEDAGQPCRHPAAGASDDPGEYSTRHNPFVFYRSLTELGDCTSNDLPLDSLAADLKTDTPNFSFVAPNLCHGGWENTCADGSAGGLAQADAFLANWVPQILASDAYKTDGLLVVLSDSGALFVSPLLPKGASDQTEVDAYSTLRYVEDLLGLDYLGKANDATPLTLAIPRD